MDSSLYLYGLLGVISIACAYLVYKNYQLSHPSSSG